MSKNVIFCFSGTGNCLDIAKNIAKELGDTDIISMRSKPAVIDVRDAERVGFVFPCYAGGLPGHVEEFVKRITVGETAYKFGVVSCAGYPGIGLGVIDRIMSLHYAAVISHQSACIWLMPHTLMIPPMDADKAQIRSEQLAAKIGKDVKNKLRSDRKPGGINPINSAESAAWKLLCAQKASQLRVTEDCIGCGQCEKLCPAGNIHMIDGRPVFGVANCVGCLGCLQFCPQQAIHMGGATRTRERYHNPKITPAELMKPVIHID